MEIIAHRGASAYAPENTLAAINLAWQQNVDGVEVDVHLTQDAQLVVIHDATLERRSGVDQRIDELTFDELQTFDVGSWKGSKWATERVPALTSVVSTIPRGKRLLVEVKCDRGCVDAFAPALSLIEDRLEAITIIGFDLAIMQECKSRYPDVGVYLVAEQKHDVSTNTSLNTPQSDETHWAPVVESLIEQAVGAGLDGLDLSNTLAVDRRAVDLMHEAGLNCCIWTVNSVEDGHRLRDSGVDSITTDDPLLFLA